MTRGVFQLVDRGARDDVAAAPEGPVAIVEAFTGRCVEVHRVV